MVDFVTAVALTLAVVGVIGAVLPLVPGPMISLAGVLLYWWGTGYADPGVVVLVGFALVAVIAVGADLFGSVVGTTAAGGDRWTAVAAGLVGVLLIPVAGPFGILAGVAIVTFAFAYRDSGETRAGVEAAAGATLGMLASIFVQVTLTIGMLIALVVVIVL